MSERVISRSALVSALVLAAAVPARAAVTPTDGVPGAGTCVSGSVRNLGSPKTAWAAIVVRPTRAFRRPGHVTLTRLGLVNTNRFPMILGVRGERVSSTCRATWLHVALPLRPNGV